jgi:NAD(P)-dependent dehydrogenase (short-subunit alcohol dehydrogenase family)
MELAQFQIRVNCICPGAIVTPIFGSTTGMNSADIDRRLADLSRFFERVQPIRRAGLPEDIANTALWLASDDSSFVTGHALVVDGGASAWHTWSNQQRFTARVEQALGLTPTE